MEEMIAEIKEKQAEIKRLQKELQEKSSKIFLSSFKKLFEETPKLQSFGWTQYTPYFND
jgi:predicted RNase H-like nuclease (RuvC/YqgF family)